MTLVPRSWLLRFLPLVLTAGILALAGLVYLVAPGVRAEVSHVSSLMLAGDTAGVRDYLLSYGVLAPVISISLMLLQAVVAPLPASLVMFANGLAFGTVPGILVSLTGQLLASLVCFGLARVVGRGVVEHLVSPQALAVADGWFARWGVVGIMIARMVPGPGFDAASYAAGLTKVRPLPLLGATAVGSLPQVALYAWLGAKAPQHLGTLVVVTVVILAALALVALWRARRPSPASTVAAAIGQRLAPRPATRTADCG
jgi:uncharacterized membrane protein YdjX (TVP38/TMEM64 family)